MSTKCRHCGSSSYGHGCAYGPDRLHEHRDDEKHCEWCGSTSYGHGCAYGPGRLHRHGPGSNKCIWCGSTSNGGGCPYSPTRRHEKWFAFVMPIHEMFLKSDAETVRELNATDPVTDPVGDPVSDPVSDPVGDPVDARVVSLVDALANGPLTAANLRAKLSVSHRKFFRDHYVNPAIRAGLVVPEEGMSLHNPRLRYFITEKGRRLLQSRKEL